MGRLIERANGLAFAAQFDALKTAAEVLLRETRARALEKNGRREAPVAVTATCGLPRRRKTFC